VAAAIAVAWGMITGVKADKSKAEIAIIENKQARDIFFMSFLLVGLIFLIICRRYNRELTPL
jgi:hypothetical protein